MFDPSSNALRPARSTPAVASGLRTGWFIAIGQYRKLIGLCEGKDYVTQDVCIAALGGEETHCRDFQGFLAEFER